MSTRQLGLLLVAALGVTAVVWLALRPEVSAVVVLEAVERRRELPVSLEADRLTDAPRVRERELEDAVAALPARRRGVEQEAHVLLNIEVTNGQVIDLADPHIGSPRPWRSER